MEKEWLAELPDGFTVEVEGIVHFKVVQLPIPLRDNCEQLLSNYLSSFVLQQSAQTTTDVVNDESEISWRLCLLPGRLGLAEVAWTEIIFYVKHPDLNGICFRGEEGGLFEQFDSSIQDLLSVVFETRGWEQETDV